MKKLRKFIVCFIVIAELMVQFQPISALVQMQVVEQFNMLGTAKRSKEKYNDNSKVEEAITKPERILPDNSSTSIHLTDYLDTTNVSNSDKLKGFTPIEKGLLNRSKNKEYKNNANMFSSILPEVLNQENSIRLEYGQTVVNYLPKNYVFEPVSINQNSAYYYTDKRNTYFRYTLGANTFKEEITLLAPQENYIFEYTLSIKNGSIESENGTIFVLDNKQNRLFELTAPVIVDSNGNKLENLLLELVQNDNDYTLKLSIDENWMNADERVYPVIIDPTFKDISTDVDTTISESNPTTPYPNEQLLKVGFDGVGRNRSFLKVNGNIITNLKNDASKIDLATLSLFAPNDFQIQTQKIKLCSLNTNFDFTNANWSNGANIASTCYESSPVIEANLRYLNDFFPITTELPQDFTIDYEVISGTPLIPMNEQLLYTLFDNNEETKILSENGDSEVHQEITINLNKFIRPEEVRLVFGGKNDSSGENISIEFINTTIQGSNLRQLVSNGMSPQVETDTQLNEFSKYISTLTFEPSSTLYNQVKLIIESTKPNGNPVLYDFQITKYQLEEHFVKLNLTSYIQKIVNNEINNNGFYLKFEDESQPLIEFYSNNSFDHKPELTVNYTSQFDVSPNYPLDGPKLFINPIVNKENNVYLFSSLTLDGIAKPGSEVTLNLYNDEINEQIIVDEKISNITTSFISPGKNFKSINDKLSKDRFNGNTLYRVEIQSKKDGIIGLKTIETFMIAELGYFKNLSDLAFFYGIDATTIKEDNKIVGAIDSQSMLFIRNPKRNIGIPYTSVADDFITETLDEEYLLGFNSSSEYFQNKVNINTGNYFLSHTDMSYMMFGEEVNITRTYNSKNKLGIQYFGESWEYNFNFVLIKYADEKIVFKNNDGQKIYFEKEGSNFVTKNNDTHTLKVADGKYQIEGKDRIYYFNTNNKIEKLVFNNGREINYTYDSQNQRLSIVQLENKDELQIGYNSTGLIESISYVSVVGTNRTIAQKVCYTYSDDQLKEVTDPMGFKTKYEYDTLGRIIKWIDKNNITVDEVTYDDENRVIQIKNPNDLVSDFKYYRNKRYTEMFQNNSFIKRVDFNSRYKTELISYANGSKESYIYDAVKGTLKIETLMNGTSVEYTYDDQQNITSIKRGDGKSQLFTYDTNNNLLSETDFLGNKTTYEYADNLRTKIIYANGSTELFTYENTLLKTHTDQKDSLTTFEYDSKGRLSKVIYPNGETKQTQYNLLGYPSREIDKDLNKRVISRNYRNEVIYETTFEGDITETSYDGNGNQISITDGNGNTRNFEYNSSNLLVKEVDPYQNYTLKTYDSFGNLISEDVFKKDIETPVVKGPISSYDLNNRLIKVKYNDKSFEEYKYNLEGELEFKIKSTSDLEKLVTQYRYDRYVNKVIQEHLPDGNIITKKYDANGNLEREINSEGILTVYKYNNLNQLISKSDDSGLESSFSYDLNGNLIKTVEKEPELRTYYSNWSNWSADSSGLLDYETKLGYREKVLDNVYKNLNEYEDYEKTGKYKISETISWLHTNGYGEPWDEFESKLIQINDKPALLTSYRDYDYLKYGSCPTSLVGIDGAFKYCKKFYARYIDYEFSGYKLIEGQETFELTPIPDTEGNKVETKILYFRNDIQVDSIQPSIEDSELIDYESILKKKYYTSSGFSEWTDNEIIKTDSNYIEIRYQYREKKTISTKSTNVTVEGYTRTNISEEIDKIAGYQHTNTHGYPWKVGLLGSIVINGQSANLYGYKDFEYLKWGDCSGSEKVPENGGYYCKKTNYKYVQYTFEALGAFGPLQDDLIIQTDKNEVEKVKQYRSEERSYSEYMANPTNEYPYESDKKIDQVSFRTRSKMIIPNDTVINLGESFDLMADVTAFDSNNNNVTNTIYTNIESIDTNVPGVHEVIYTLGSTGLEVIRIIQVQDNSENVQLSDWNINPNILEEVEGNNSSLVKVNRSTRYIIPLSEWSSWDVLQPSITPNDGDFRHIEVKNEYQERTRDLVYLTTSTPPDSNHIFIKRLPTVYSSWTDKNIDWDACTPISGEQILARGGIDNDVIKKRSSVISGYWYYAQYPNEVQFSYYPHVRCGVSVRYKYGKQFANASKAYRIIESTRTFNESYEFEKYGLWTDWLPGTLESDFGHERINRTQYRYIDGNLTDWINDEESVPENSIIHEQNTVYYTRNQLKNQKSIVLKVNALVDLKEYFSFIDPVLGDLSNNVNIKIVLNGVDLSTKLDNTSFKFDSVGNYDITYQVNELVSKQTIFVKGNQSERITENTYNEMNQMITSKDALGHLTTYQYSNNQLVLKTDALGNQEVYTYNRNNQLIEKRVIDTNQTLLSKISYTYDGVGNKKSETDIFGFTTLYEYDSNNHLAILKKPVYDEAKQVKYSITEYKYDAAGRLIEEIIPPTNENNDNSDPTDKQLITTYDDMGRVKKIVSRSRSYDDFEESLFEYNKYGQASTIYKQKIKTEYVYNAFGDVLKEVHSNGLIIFRDYDRNHRVVKEIKTNKDDRSLIDDSDRITETSYNHLGQVSSQIDELGRKKIINYDRYGNITTVKNFDNQYIKNYYNVLNQLELNIDSRGAHTYQYYNELNHLKLKVDGLGNQTKYETNSLGYVTKQTNALNEVTSYEVDMYGNITKQIDAADYVTLMEYGPGQKLISKIYKDINGVNIKNETYLYDKLGRLKVEKVYFHDPIDHQSVTITTSKEYDAFGNVVSTIDARGYKTEYTYDRNNRLKSTIYPTISETSKHLTVTNEYDVNSGLLISTKKSGENEERVVSYKYNHFNEKIEETFENGSYKTYEYRVDGQLQREIFSNDNEESVEDDYIKNYYYDANGRLITLTDNAGFDSTTQTEIDQVLESRSYYETGDLKSVTNQAGLQTEYLYDLLGRQITQTVMNINHETMINNELVSTRLNLSTHYQYDPLNRIVQTSYANGIIETLDYDERGNVVKKSLTGSSETREESYVYNGLNQCVETINALNESTYQHVNAIGQIRQTILPNGESTSYKYDSNGNKIKETRENEDKTKSITTEWVYNEVNQMTQIKEIRLDGNDLLTSYVYSVFGDLVKVQDPEGTFIEYEYDKAGNKTKTKYQNDHEIVYTYTSTNQLKEKKYSDKVSDPLEQFTTKEVYTYTRDGKLKTFRDNPPISESEPTLKVYYEYTKGQLSQKLSVLSKVENQTETILDSDRIKYVYDELGQVVQMMDSEGTTYTHRDMNQQITQVTRVHQDVRNEENGLEEISRNETGQESVSYMYSIWGNQTKLIYPDGTSVIYTYDALDRLVSVTDSTGVSQISYLTDEHQIIETRNRWTKTRTYELDQVISLRETTLNEEDEEVVLFSQVLSYDETDQVIREERTQNNVLTVIENEYNLRGELRQSTQTCGNSKVTYLYTTTPWGNKSETILREVNGENVSIESKTFTYNHLNQMEHVIQDTVETTFTYDARGNLIEERIGSQVIKTYTYDVSNRLIKVQDASETQDYTYDGEGNRLTKTIQDTLTEEITHHVYYVNDTSVENERVIQVQDNTENRNVVYGLERIHEAGVLYLSDSYGNIIQHGTKTYAYTPYGELTEGIITGVNEAGYKGEVHDTESLQYLRARTYHTKYQVFLSEDTVVGSDTHPLSQNRYTFALNNPYKYSDPSGNVPVGRQRTIQDEQAFQESEVELINRYVKPVKDNDYKPDEPITDNSPFYDDLGALQRALNQKTQDSINASKKIASEDSLNPYNYQPSISTKQSGDVHRFSESNPLNDPNTKTFLKGVSNMFFGGGLFVTGMLAGISIFATGGLALIPTIIMATGGALYGSSKLQEGIHQVLLGANGKGEEKSYNYLRDTVFQGNQAVYDAVGMLSTFGPALPTIVKAIPQLAAPVLGALGLRQVVYETTGSEEAANLATDAMMFGPVLQQVNKAVNPGQMDDIIIQTSDEALSLVDDVLDDGVKNTVDNVVDDTANQLTSETSTLEGGNKSISSGGRLGNATTRAQNEQISTYLEKEGWEITGGGGRLKEEYLPGLGGGSKGSNYVDITATKNGQTIRINTVDIYKNGQMTTRETNAARLIDIKTGGNIITIPKGTGLGDLADLLNRFGGN